MSADNPDADAAEADQANRAETGDPELFERIVNLSKRRGFAFQSADIYGGFRSAYDYGPLGVLLLRNVKEQWWRSMVQLRHDVVGIDASILSPPAVWEASGHLNSFSDPLVDCRNCNDRHRLDKLDDPEACPSCGARGAFTEARDFNLMFRTHAGPVAETAAEVFLRPETAQGAFVNFANVLQTSRKRPPFGIAQIGKSFRNEITPGNFVFRTREFEQMELEYFVAPDSAAEWYQYWCDERMGWYLDLGIDDKQLRLREHGADERSHYSSRTADVEYRFPWGWDELEGIADRGAYDLSAHAEASGERLEYFDAAAGEHWVPHVIEPAAGATRAALAFLMDAYDTETVNDEARTVLRLDHRLAPYKAAVLPLSKKDPLPALALEVFDSIKGRWMADYDETQSIGRRYARQDEIGTPFCVTVDFDTIDDRAVTVRKRDGRTQDRVAIERLADYLAERLD